ncbi:MAG TPA: HigA family addiction module antitoxin [Tepidiformaceae bacterium]
MGVNSMAERIPAEVFPPGGYIRDELEARGWTQADLAEILGKSLPGIGEILNDRRGITADTAKGLAEAFGTSAEVWLNLDARYRLASATPTPGTKLRSQIYSKAPVREMVKRQWIEGSTNPEVLGQRVCDFLGIASLDEEPRDLAHAARNATSYEETSPRQMAWLCRVAELAHAAPAAGTYSAAKLPELVTKLRALVPNERDIRQVASLLSNYGIRFLIVEHLAQSKIDGVCYWLDKDSPVVALSLRYGRLDSFWHTLFHELGHVKKKDGKDGNGVVDLDLTFSEDGLPLIERSANTFAVETLIPKDEMEGFINRVGPAYSLRNIQGFAARIKVHPAIVIGQLAHRKEITWSRFGTHLPNVRDHVAAAALTDGWGHALPSLSER